MPKTCERHINKPVVGYSSCVGCEIERIKREAKDSHDHLIEENEALLEENERLLFASRNNLDMYEQMNDARKQSEYERDRLKSALRRFMEIDVDASDLRDELWIAQQEEAPAISDSDH